MREEFAVFLMEFSGIIGTSSVNSIGWSMVKKKLQLLELSSDKNLIALLCKEQVRIPSFVTSLGQCI